MSKIEEEKLWNLGQTIIELILPYLKAFKKMKRNGYPSLSNSSEEWESILDRMIEGFEIAVIHQGFPCDRSLDKKIDEAKELFSKYWENLCD